VVAITYVMFLRNVGNDQGLERLVDQLMHYATPLMFVLDWLVFVPKGRVPWTTIGTSLIVPVGYGAWTIVHGSVSHWYPYPFVDMRSLGYQEGLMSMAGFLVVFIAVALVLVVIDRSIGSARRARR